MKINSPALALLILAALTACHSGPATQTSQNKLKPEEEAQINRDIDARLETMKHAQANLPPAPQSAPRPNRPKVGMEVEDFKELCGPLHPLTDDMNTYEVSGVFVSSYYYEYDHERGDKGCYGTFTFRDHRLYSIYR